MVLGDRYRRSGTFIRRLSHPLFVGSITGSCGLLDRIEYHCTVPAIIVPAAGTMKDMAVDVSME